jgi:Family of unknown function (DUF5309)
MATITNAYTTASAVGIREDLTDNIFRVDVEDTPMIGMVGSGKAKAVLHEWQTRILAPVNTSNAEPEGDSQARSASTPNMRINNICQISKKDATTSGTLEAVDKAGRNTEMSLQMADRAIELRKDMEAISLSNQAYTNSSPRLLRGFEAWMRTNTSRGVGGVNPADPTVTPGTTATDGTLRSLTETVYLDNLQAIYAAGGRAQFSLMGPGQKRVASTFTGRATAREMVDKSAIHQATNLYASDFGTMKFVPHRYLRANGRTLFNVDPDMVKISYLRKFIRFPLAKIGDAETRVILSEYTLEMSNERAHGVVCDLLPT